jgi:hypothetical protein
MFKISIVDTQAQRRLVVEGTLVGPWITELRIAWSNAMRNLDGRKLRIDLRSVTVINREAECGILDLMKQGAQFTSGDICTKYMVKRLARECQCKRREAADGTARETERALGR